MNLFFTPTVHACGGPGGDPPPVETGASGESQGPVPFSGVYDPPKLDYPFGSKMGSDYAGIGVKKITPYFDVGNNVDYKGNAAVSLYGVVGDEDTFIIKNAGAGCQSATSDGTPSGRTYGAPPIASGPSGGPDFGDGKADGSGGPPTGFKLTNSGLPLSPNWSGGRAGTGNLSAGYREMDASDSCKNLSFDFNFTNSNSQPLTDPYGNPVLDGDGKPIHYVTLQVLCPQSALASGENEFRVQGVLNNAAAGSGRIALSGLSSGLSGYGFRDISADDSPFHHWTSQLVFTVSGVCSDLNQGVPIGTTGSNSSNINPAPPIIWKDIDLAKYGDGNITLDLQERPIGELVNWSDTGGFHWHARDAAGGKIGAERTASGDFTPTQNGQIDWFKFYPNMVYRLVIKNSGTENTVFVQLQDELSSLATRLNPTPKGCTKFSCSAEVVDADTVRVIITNKATYAWGNGYQVRERDVNGNPVSVAGVNQVWPASGFSTNIDPGDTRTSTDTKEPSPPFPANTSYFARPPNAEVSFVLYDDTGSGANKVSWSPNVPCSTTTKISVTCAVVVGDVEPGQSDSQLYLVTLTATGNGPGGDYGVKLDPQPGANVTDSPKTQNIAGDPGSGKTYPVNFDGYLTYGDNSTTGGVTATVTNPDGSTESCDGNGQPASRPYFVVRGGGLSTGGGFKDINGNCSTGGMPFISPYDSSNNYILNQDADSGGLRAFSYPSSHGSSADLEVDALGEIYKNPSPNTFVGFYSGVNALFANVIPSSNPDLTGTSLGGFLNSNSTAHCVRDFYDKTKKGTPQPINTSSFDVTNKPGQWQYSGGADLNITGGNISAGTQTTIYVDGNVTISNNITSDSNWDASKPKNVPFLTIVARGNITLTSGVSRLDGLFIAQPIVTNADIDSASGKIISYSGGQFNTCDDFCPNQLVVNGAVIAQEVHLLRAHGTLGGKTGVLDHDTNNLKTHPAEIFNFSPAMLIGTPDFSQDQTGSNNFYSSLPPVF